MPFDNSNYNPLPIGHQRLLVLADFLETKVPDEDFNLRRWLHPYGSPSCAIGYAGIIPEFRALGFGVSYRGGPRGSNEPFFGDIKRWEAIQTFFEISYATAAEFFTRMRYETAPGPRQVAARIRAFVADANAKALSQTNEIGAVARAASA